MKATQSETYGKKGNETRNLESKEPNGVRFDY